MTFSRRTGLAIFLAGIVAVAATNIWPGYDYGISALGQNDTRSYRAIALAAPGIPDQPVSYQHAQRFWIHWATGVVAQWSGLSLDLVCRGVALALLAGIAWNVWRIVSLAGVPPVWSAVLALVWAFNPYCVRYFLAVPWMAADLLFVLGFSILVSGVLRWSVGLAVCGLIVAAFGRQTVLVCLLATWVVVLWRSREFKAARPAELGMLCAASAIVVAVYWAGGRYAAATGAMPNNLNYLTGLFGWLGSDATDKPGQMADFALRGLVSQGAALPLLLVLLVKMARPPPAPFWLAAILVASVWAQPILAGPDITGSNISRLGTLGYPGLLAMAVIAVRESGMKLEPWAFWTIAIAALCGSFHHRWSSPGQMLFETTQQYAVLLASTSVLAGIAAFLGGRAERLHGLETGEQR